MPLKMWDSLKKAGWHSRITVHHNTRVLAEYVEADGEFAKLHLWALDPMRYDWILYMDSDVFMLRSIVPMLEEAFLTRSIAAVKQHAGVFSTGTLVLRPSRAEYERLVHRLQSKGNSSITMQLLLHEKSLFQAFLNEAFAAGGNNNWTEISAANGGMSLEDYSSLCRRKRRSSRSRHNPHRNQSVSLSALEQGIQAIRFTSVKPWSWQCPYWTEYAHLCYLFWNFESMRFHRTI